MVKMKINNIFKLIQNEFIHGGHLISLSSVCILLMTTIILDLKDEWQPLFIAYLITFSGLLYNRYREQKTDFLTNPQRTIFLKKYFCFTTPIIILCILASVFILVFYWKIASLILVFFLFFICFIYTKQLKKVTEKVIAFKDIIFSLIVSLLIIFLATYLSYPLINTPLFLIWLFVFLRMMVNAIFLDIKDIKSDNENRLKTIPIIWGQKNTFIFLQVLSVFSVLPIIIGYLLNKLPIVSLVLILIIPYSFYYFEKSKKKEGFCLSYYILTDSEFIFLFIVIKLANLFL